MQENFDLFTNTLIIGAGPAGATLAKELNQKNIDNILIEKNLNYDKPCGGGIKSIVFEEFNLPKYIENKKVTKVNLFSSSKKSIFNIQKAPLSIVLRKEFDKMNRELAVESGSKLIEGKYQSLDYFEDFIIAKIKTKEKIIKIKAKYLVAADGVTSSVKKDVLNSSVNSLLTNYVIVKDKEITSCDFYFDSNYAPKQYAWVFPHGKDTSIGVIFHNNAKSRKVFTRLLKEHNASNFKIKGFYIPVWQDKATFYEKRVFFVGDAAGQIMPFTYEGIYYAMHSSRILSNAIFQDNPNLYKEQWNKKFRKTFKSYEYLQKVFLSSDFMVNKMLGFFQNKKIEEKALQYWNNRINPLSFRQILTKSFKYLVKRM